MIARLTVVTSRRPATLSKTVRRGEDGALVRGGGGVLVDGRAEVAEVSGLAELASLLEGLGPAQALTFGVPKAGGGRVSSRAFRSRLDAAASGFTRTRDAFAWPDGPGVMMLDHDADGETYGRDDLVSLIRQAAPGLADAAMLWWPSASSHIHDAVTGADLTGLRGQRLYLLVADARDVPRAGAALVDRLWAAGHGRIVVSVAGAALERCPVDASVWQPERLDFAAGACCGDGLVQRRGAPTIVPGGVETVDTRAALADDAGVAKAAAAARLRAKAAAADAIHAAREAFLDAQADAMLRPEDRDDPKKREAARAAARRAVESGVLSADFPVEVETAPGRFETVTVGRILDDRAAFDGRLTRDPLEPDYDGGRATGKLFLRDARPTLFSFARHGRSFRLVRAAARIELAAGRTAAATEAALGVLRDDPAIYDFGGQVALVEDGRLLALDEHALGFHLAGAIQFWRSAKVGAELVPTDVDPPARLVRQILSLGPRRGLKALSAIVTAPTLRPDGSILATPGYDARTGLLVDLSDDAPEIDATPGRDAVARALATLMAPFETFPLVDRLARGGLLAALLTAVVRPTLLTAPAFAMDAPVQGSGKTLLASCVAALATGLPPEIWPHAAGRDDEEVRKRLFAALRDGATALVWDNVTGVFDSAALAAAITAPVLRDRVLGRSVSLAIPNRALLLLTGNNLCPAGDLPRRVVTIRIDPATDAPFARSFARDPLEHVLAHRMELACAALTLIRGRMTATAPRAEGRMASFEAWDDLVRQTVCWIAAEIAPDAYGDPLDLVRAAQGADPEQEGLFALLTALESLYGRGWFTAREVSQRAAAAQRNVLGPPADTALAEALADFAGERAVSSSKTVGRVLQFRQGRIVFGLRLVSRPGRSGREYRVDVVRDEPACGFGGFGGFESGDSEKGSNRSAGQGRHDDPFAETKRPESNPPNPPNPQDAAGEAW